MNTTSLSKLTHFLICSVMMVVFASSVAAIEYGGVGGRPAYPDPDNSRTESIFLHTIEPGESVEDGVQVINNTDETKILELYAADSIHSSGGGFGCKQQVEDRTEVGTWLDLPSQEVTLESQTNTIVPFTITVPEGTEVGEHNACILIQEKTTDEEEQKAGVNLSFRTGLRVGITVPGEIIKKVEPQSISAAAKGSDLIQVTVSLKNSGNVSVDSDIQVVVKDMFGGQSEDGGTFLLLPRETSEFNFDLPVNKWGGWKTARYSLSYDANTSNSVGQSTNAQIEELVGEEITIWMWPHPQISIAVLVSLGITVAVVLILIKKWKNTTHLRNNWVELKITKNMDIQSLADEYNVNWKQLASINKLKPPYTLKPGHIVLVPPTGEPKTKKAESVTTEKKVETKKSPAKPDKPKKSTAKAKKPTKKKQKK